MSETLKYLVLVSLTRRTTCLTPRRSRFSHQADDVSEVPRRSRFSHQADDVSEVPRRSRFSHQADDESDASSFSFLSPGGRRV